jgi:hypothetical protein
MKTFKFKVLTIFILWMLLINSTLSQELGLKLQTKLELVETLYCKDNHLRLRAKLFYTNLGKTKILLSRFSNSPSRFTVYKVEKNGDLNKQMVANIMFAVRNLDYLNNNTDEFIELAPNEKVVFEHQIISVGIQTKEFSGGLKAGKYKLKYVLVTFPYFYKGEKSELQKRNIWTDQVVGEMEFSIEDQITIWGKIKEKESCQEIDKTPIRLSKF